MNNIITAIIGIAMFVIGVAFRYAAYVLSLLLALKIVGLAVPTLGALILTAICFDMIMQLITLIVNIPVLLGGGSN